MKSRSSVIDQHFPFCHYSCHKFWRSGFIFKLIIYGRIVKISFRGCTKRQKHRGGKRGVTFPLQKHMIFLRKSYILARFVHALRCKCSGCVKTFPTLRETLTHAFFADSPDYLEPVSWLDCVNQLCVFKFVHILCYLYLSVCRCLMSVYLCSLFSWFATSNGE